MHAVVLAGGRGSRLGDLTLDVPKPMITVAGRPFLAFVLDRLVDAGVSLITLSVGYKAQVIRAHFGTNYRGTRLCYAVEEEPLGTGGAAAFALQGATDEPALVLNGDTLLQVDLAAVFDWYHREPARVAMVLREMDDVSRYGAVSVTDDRVTGFLEKGREGPGLINAGVYLVQPSVFGTFDLPRIFSFETDLLQRYCQALRPRAFVTNAWFIDIGIPADLERARRELAAPAS